MGLDSRLEKLRRQNDHLVTNLVCGECGERFTVYGRDVAVELIVADWTQTSGEGYDEIDETIRAILEHVHGTDSLLDAKSGRPLDEVSGVNASWLGKVEPE
jgi:hypothetical protein